MNEGRKKEEAIKFDPVLSIPSSRRLVTRSEVSIRKFQRPFFTLVKLKYSQMYVEEYPEDWKKILHATLQITLKKDKDGSWM
jgi:hypothetical protein